MINLNPARPRRICPNVVTRSPCGLLSLDPPCDASEIDRYLSRYFIVSYGQILVNYSVEVSCLVCGMRGIQYSRRSRRGHGAAIALLPLRDFVLASISLAIALPLMIVVAAAIKCDSPGPALVRRARIARDGRHFQLLEFRTTLHDPEKTAATWDQQRTRVGLALYHTASTRCRSSSTCSAATCP